MKCILEMLFMVAVFLELFFFHLHHVDCKKVTIKAATCLEFYRTSKEDPYNRTTSWALNPEPEKLDCSVCNAQDTTDAWLLTKDVSAPNIKGIHVSVTMYRSRCQKCRNQDIKVYILYKSRWIDEFGEILRTLKNLPLVTILSNERDGTVKMHDFRIEPKASSFSIVFRSSGSCTLIKYISVHYFVCRKDLTGGVNLPRTFAPVSGLKNVTFSCSNSLEHNGYGLCSSEGIWKNVSHCTCQKGYTLVNNKTCIECQARTYKDIPGSGKCVPCPRNSESCGGKLMCRCKVGSYRFRGENYTQPCYGIPSAVEDIVSTYKTDSSINLQWIPPIRQFGQNVLYDITCHKCLPRNLGDPCKWNCGSFVTFRPSQNNLTATYITIEGLEKDTEYQFVVYSKNQSNLRINKTNWHWRSAKFITDGSTKLSTSSSGKNVVIGILGAVVVVMAIVMSILFIYVYRLRKQKRCSADYAQPTIELPNMRVAEAGYEEPAQYQQLDSSRRVPVDANYQSLQNANYTQLNRNLKEVVQQYASLIKDGSSTTDNAPKQ